MKRRIARGMSVLMLGLAVLTLPVPLALAAPGATPTMEWQKNGLKVENAPHRKIFSAIADGTGGFYVVALLGDHKGGSRKIRVQRIEPDGSSAWNDPRSFSGPITVVQDHEASAVRVPVAVTNNGSLLVAWAETRNQCGNEDARATKAASVSTDRRATSAWVTGEIHVECDHEGEQHSPFIITDDNGGSIVGYKDTYYSDSIRVQRLMGERRFWSSSGTGAFRTPPTVCIGSRQYRPPVLAGTGDGGAFVIWTASTSSCEGLLAQRHDPNGWSLWGDAGLEVTAPDPGGKWQQDPVVAADGLGGIIVAWVDGGGDVRAQRLDDSGHRLWGDEGIAVAADPLAVGTEVALAVSPGSGIVLAWASMDSMSGTRHLKMKRLFEDGTIVWSLEGIGGGAESDQAEISLAPGPDGRLLVTWSEKRGMVMRPGRVRGARGNASAGWDVYAQLLDADGRMLWRFQRAWQLPIGTGKGDQQLPQALATAPDEWVVVWTDDRPGDSGIYAQRLTFGSTLSGEAGPRPFR